MTAFSISVDTNASMRNKFYYVFYKGTKFKYIRNDNKSYTDTLVAFINNNDTEEAYRLMTEFMRAFAYKNNLSILFSLIMSSEGISEHDITSFVGGVYDRKHVPIDTRVDELAIVCLIDNDNKSELLRLFTEADSANNIYLKILFYWHSLVYPARKEDEAIYYIDSNAKKISYISEYIEFLRQEKVFGEFEGKTLGEYIRSNVRNSIAHIVRDRNNFVSLSIDAMSQLQALHCVKQILREVSRHRLDTDYGMDEFAGYEIVHNFTPQA